MCKTKIQYFLIISINYLLCIKTQLIKVHFDVEQSTKLNKTCQNVINIFLNPFKTDTMSLLWSELGNGTIFTKGWT